MSLTQNELLALEDEELIERQESLDEQADMTNFPETASKQKEGLFTLLREVWKTPNSIKTGNLNIQDIGRPLVHVRGGNILTLAGNITGHKDFADMFSKINENTLASSSSRNGWLVSTMVSNIKKTERTLSGGSTIPDLQKSKGIMGMFGKKEKVNSPWDREEVSSGANRQRD